jgi:hypothetical protein
MVSPLAIGWSWAIIHPTKTDYINTALPFFGATVSVINSQWQ